MVKMLGYDSTTDLMDATNGSVLQIWQNPGDRLRYAQLLETHGFIRAFECQLKRKDGKPIWVLFNTRKVRDPDGNALYYEGFAQDITERKQAEAKLQTALAQLRDAEQMAHIGSFRWDVKSDITTWSDELHRIVGWDPSRPAPSRSRSERASLYTPESYALLEQAIVKALSTGVGYQLDLELIRTDGVCRQVHVRGEVIRDEDGTTVALMGILHDITERKQAESALRLSESRFRALFEHSLDGFMLTMTSGQILAANPGACRMFGRSEAELIQGGRALIVAADDARLPALLEQRERTGRLQGEVTMVRSDGTRFETEVASAVYNSDEGPRTSMVIRDITERKQAEAAQLQLVAIINSSGDGIYSTTMDGTITSWNAAAEKMYGYSAKEILGQPMVTLFPPELVDDEKDILARLGRGESIPHFDTMRIRKNGTHIPISLAISPVKDSNGTITGTSRIARDITEQKRSKAALRRSEEKFSKVFMTVPAGIVLSTLNDGVLREINEEYAHIFGHKREDMLGQTSRSLGMWQESKDREAMTHRLQTDGFLHDYELKMKRKDGSIIDIRFSAQIMDLDGVAYIVGAFIDISERKKLEEQLNRAQRLESIGNLASGIAHDLNNVLAPIMLGLEILGENIPDADSQRLITTMGTSAKRGSEIVKQVLTFGRGAEGERLLLQPRYLVDEVMQIIHETFPKSVKIRIDVPKTLWTLLVDPTQMHQALLNLSVNARDAMPQGGSLTISAENVEIDAIFVRMYSEVKTGPYVLIKINDTGEGIPPEIRDKIFDPFFTTKEVGKGTGLGLSTVHSIVKRHGGFINLYSEIGKGTSFQIYLPAKKSTQVQQGESEVLQGPKGKGELVLVVDDEAAIREITMLTLETNGYRVLCASDGTEALACYAQRGAEIAVVITDIMMPNLDGEAAIQVLLKMNPEVKIIAVSGLPENTRLALRDTSGSIICLAKPFSAETILETLRRMIDGGNKTNS